ncbi:MAG: hypothetical protein ABWK15_00290 [Dissulfuribacterales bacterium]
MTTDNVSQHGAVSDPLGLEEAAKPNKNLQVPLGDLTFEEIPVSETADAGLNPSGAFAAGDSALKDIPSAASASSEKDGPAEKEATGEDAAAEGAKAEDELWDEGSDFEEVPLFEEFASKIAEAESKPKNIVEELSSELEAAVAGQEQAIEPEKDEVSAGGEERSVSSSSSILPWLVSGIACLFMLGGGWVFWRMYSGLSAPTGPVQVQQPAQIASPSIHNVPSAPVSVKTPEQTSPVAAPAAQRPSQEHTNPADAQRLAPLEYISLAPFLIPAQQGGEPVFFKLQVELICRDKQMKEELNRKETWVRDAIYREMKGIDLSAGVQENNINRFRRPILDRINRELAPLYVDDIRLMGTLLK